MTACDNYHEDWVNLCKDRERETWVIRDAILDSKLGAPLFADVISPATAIILAQEIWEALHWEALTTKRERN
jgi:hypothetical protein